MLAALINFIVRKKDKKIYELLSKIDFIPPDVIHQASIHGLHWDMGMKEIIEKNTASLESRNKMTGFLPFMSFASSGEECDLDTLFEMMRIHPSLRKKKNY